MTIEKEKFLIQFLDSSTREVRGELLKHEKLPNVEFFVHRFNRKYSISEKRTGRSLVEGCYSKKQAKNKFYKTIDSFGTPRKFNNRLKKQKSIEEFKQFFNNDLKSKEEKEFEEVFKMPMPLDRFVAKIYGSRYLDVIKLDEQLNVPDDISILDFVQIKYNGRARQLVDELSFA